jgi:hypothetical protein
MLQKAILIVTDLLEMVKQEVPHFPEITVSLTGRHAVRDSDSQNAGKKRLQFIP